MEKIGGLEITVTNSSSYEPGMLLNISGMVDRKLNGSYIVSSARVDGWVTLRRAGLWQKVCDFTRRIWRELHWFFLRAWLDTMDFIEESEL